MILKNKETKKIRYKLNSPNLAQNKIKPINAKKPQNRIYPYLLSPYTPGPKSPIF
jgi:hypothetical protein